MQIILGNLDFKATVNFRMDFIQISLVDPERGIAAASPHLLKNAAQNFIRPPIFSTAVSCAITSYPFIRDCRRRCWCWCC